MAYIKEITEANLRPDLPDLHSGQTVRVHLRIQEAGKERIQVFEGQIIAIKHGRGLNATMTVRKIASGVGVERIFPLHTPAIKKIEVAKDTRARRAKLYYTRKGKPAKTKDMSKTRVSKKKK